MGAMLGDNQTLNSIPIVGGLFGDPAAKNKQQTMYDTAKAYQAERPEQIQARMNAANMQLQNLQGAADVLSASSGKPTAAASAQNPFGPSAQSVGQPKPSQGGGGILGGIF